MSKFNSFNNDDRHIDAYCEDDYHKEDCYNNDCHKDDCYDDDCHRGNCKSKSRCCIKCPPGPTWPEVEKLCLKNG